METILVVEDNPFNMELSVDLLENEGYKVISAESPVKAIMLAEKEIPDLILMDINLPGMDGYIATGYLKHNEQTQNIPIIALTAHAMKGDEEKVRLAGCDGYIAKPIHVDTFLRFISDFFDSRRIK